MASVLTLLGLLVIPAVASAEILQRWDFEGDQPLKRLKQEGEEAKVIVDPVDRTNHVMESILRTTSQRKERSEVRWDGIPYGSERWVAARILVPEASPQPFACLFQVGPIKNKDDKQGKGWFQIQTLSPSRDWVCRMFLERINQPPVREKVGKVAQGQWETWVVHFRLSNDESGFAEVWRDGKKVYQGKGPNAKPGDSVPLKWGVYVGSGNDLKQDMRILYDDIVMGDEKSSHEEVVKAQAKTGAAKPKR